MKILLIIVIAAVLLQIVELQRFNITTYRITSKKIKSRADVLFLSDLHGKTFGKRLIKRIRNLSPDHILIGGDVISKKNPKEMDYMPDFLKQLKEIAPVFYGFGNHETTIDEVYSREMPTYGILWQEYLEKVQEAGIPVIRNERFSLREDISVLCLELPEQFYQKLKTVEATEEDIQQLVPAYTDDLDTFQILLAHNPAFSEQYTCLNPDLILSGHTHGGLVRFPFVGSLISAELTWNPKYDGGCYRLFTKDGRESTLIVSKGLGTHTYPIRILDRAEAIHIILEPEK